MPVMEERFDLPDISRLSVLSATILLGYALTRFITLPSRIILFYFVGVQVSLEVDFRTAVSIIVALLAAAGSDWLLRGHPAYSKLHRNWGSNWQHWFLPALTAWVIGVPLNNLTGGPGWWIVFGMGGIMLVLVLLAEYSVVNPTEVRFPAAGMGLTALSFGLYLLLAIALQSASSRLYLILPAIMIAAGMVCLRTFYLRLRGEWLINWAVTIMIIVGQLTIGLHYLPVSPVSFGLILLGPTFALTSFATLWAEKKSWSTMLAEPLIMLILVCGLAWWLK